MRRDQLCVLDSGRLATSLSNQDNTLYSGVPNLSVQAFDMGGPNQLAPGHPIYAHFHVTTAFASAGSPVLRIDVIQSESADLLTSDYLAIGSTQIITLGGLLQDAHYWIALQPLGSLYDTKGNLGEPDSGTLRYVGAYYWRGVAAYTAGAFTMELTTSAPILSKRSKLPPKSFTIDVG